jgi:hypothetical protein
LTDLALDSIVVYYTNAKENFSAGSNLDENTVKLASVNESRNRDTIVKSYDAKRGYYIFRISNKLHGVNFRYSLQVLTNEYRVIATDEFVTDYLTNSRKVNYYELYLKKPGFVYLDFKKCFGDAEFYYKISEKRKYFKKLQKNATFGNLIQVERPGPVFFIVKQKNGSQFAQKKDSNDQPTAVFSFQFHYKKDYQKLSPFEKILTNFDSETNVQLGAWPKIDISPINLDSISLSTYNFKIMYHLVMSTSQTDVEFLAGCDR